MADTPKRKITKKSSSFSYDRRRDSVKVRRQSKSLSFKSATLGAQKRQAQKKQVCIWKFLKKNSCLLNFYGVCKSCCVSMKRKAISADLQSVCVGMCIYASLCAGKAGFFFCNIS